MEATTGFVIELEAQPCGIVRIDKSIIVGCMGNVCHSYFKKGTKKNYSIYLPAPITNMTHMKSKEHNFQVRTISSSSLFALNSVCPQLSDKEHNFQVSLLNTL